MPSPGPPGPVLRYLSSEMGGLGPGGMGGGGLGAVWRPLPSIDIHHFCVFDSFSRSLVFHRLKGGGGSCRRQGKSAAPSGRRGELVGFGLCSGALLVNEQREGGGWSAPKSTAPAPRGRFCDTSRAKWGVRGPGGRTCEIMLWCRRGRILSKIMLSLAPEHDFHTSCAQSRQGRSGASGPGV